MAFDDEIVRLLANRTAYLDFSHVNNPGAVDWPDPLVKLYGKIPDSRGTYPIEGTVMAFGTLQRAVSNADFTLEIPSLTIELIDRDHFWRARAVPPSLDLLYRWVQLYLRVGRAVMQPLDPATLLAYYDQRIAVGQITKASFGAAKHVSLECQLTGGKWLGEMIPRRTVTLDDFPRCAPENLGKAVPIVFGRFSNAIGPDNLPIAGATGCRQKERILIQEAWANGNSVAFNGISAGDSYYEADTGPGTGVDPVDPLYPTLTTAEAVWVYIDHPLAGYGINMLWVHPDFNPAPPDDDWGIAGVAFRQFDSGLPDYYNGVPGGSYRPFDATEMWATVTYYPDQWPLADLTFIYCPLYAIWDDYGFFYGMNLVAVDYYYDEHGVVQNGDTAMLYLALEYAVWNEATQYEIGIDMTVLWGTRASLLDTRQEFVVCHKCGTYTYDPTDPRPGGWATVASDGYVRVYVNGTLKIALENIPLTMQEGWWTDAGRDRSNYGHTISFGWSGLIGPVTDIIVTCGDTETPVVSKCAEEPGTGVNLASGALRGLLVDTGKQPTGPDAVATPITIDTSLPTVTGHEAHNVFGGGTINKAVFFYVAARKESGAIGPISSIVDLDNDYDPEQEAHAASLSWVQAGGATAYVVWMTQDPNFHPVDRPDLGSPRTKIIKAETGSTFPPISGPDFDYQVLFTSLTDGTAYGSAAAEGYRYLLAGHTLQGVDQVYVLKPVPTVKNDADKSVLVGDHAAGAATMTVAFDSDNEDIGKFSKDQNVIIAGDPEPYTILNSDEGVHGITPPLRKAFTTGTVVAKATDEDAQVLQRENVDYTQEVIEVNGNRYHTLVFTDPQQNEETCAQYEVTANVRGQDLHADGTGFLIDHGVSITQHFFKNWIFNDYRSSIGPFATDIIGGRWFEDVAYAPGLINNDSFYAANLVASGRLQDSYIGAGALTEQIPATQLIYDLISSFDLDLYHDHSTGVGAWSVSMLNSEEITRAEAPEYVPELDTIRDSFTIDLGGQTPHANVLPYVAGPMTGRMVGQSNDDTGGYLIGGEVRDLTSIGIFGQLTAQPMELKWTRHAATAYSVAMHRLRMIKTPSIHASMTVPIGTVNDSLCTVVAITHPDGFGPNGWTQRLCRVMRSDVDLDRMVLHLLLRDIDDLVAP